MIFTWDSGTYGIVKQPRGEPAQMCSLARAFGACNTKSMGAAYAHILMPIYWCVTQAFSKECITKYYFYFSTKTFVYVSPVDTWNMLFSRQITWA